MLRQNTRRLALAIALGTTAGQAYAFGLGGVKVQSYLGQPLQAEIDITQLSADEASSLKVGVASPDAFQAAKLHYSSVLAGVQISLERRADGQAYLRVISNSPVREPFLDLLIRAQWANGQLSRDYTLLLDPPNFQEAPRTAQVPVQTAPPVQPLPPQQMAAPAAPALQLPPHAAPATRAPAEFTGSYVVKKGDTLNKIANDTGVEAVSLDQMLTAIYRANQSAFINRNINLVKAGAVLQIPSAGQAQQIPQSEAHRFVITQSQDFNAYRRRLAEMSGQAKPEAAQSQREASGKVQAEVQEPTSTTNQAESKLKLSKAEVAGKGGAPTAQQIADQKQQQANAQKISQLQKNVEDLSALSKQAQTVAAATGAAPQVAAVASKPASPLTLPAATPVPASAPYPAASSTPVAAATASTPAVPAASAVKAAASTPAIVPQSKAAAPKAAEPKPQPSESFFSGLLANPLLLPAGGGLVVLLLLLAWLAQRKKQSKSQRDVSVFDSRMSVADSFFGGTGGERVDTRNSSMGSTFSSSQIDTNDVDPVAEADVYLAYGRDLQAEEILKEAVKANPERNAARLKLLEIYAKRKDSRSFEVGAAELFALTQGVGEDWKRAQDLGRGLDPVNPLYHNTLPPSTLGMPSTMPQTEFPAATPTALAALAPATLPSTEMLSGLDLAAARPVLPEHLDLDLSLPGSEDARTAATAVARPSVPSAASLAELPQIDVPEGAAQNAVAAATAANAPSKTADDDFLMSGLDFNVPSDFGAPVAPAVAETPAPAAHAEQHTPLEFDLSGISLQEPDLRPAQAGAPRVESVPPEFGDSQPVLDIRFELASESLAIGDLESARNLLGEVIAEGEPQLKARAQEMLDKIGR